MQTRLEAKVLRILNRYRAVTALPSLVTQVFATPELEDMLWNSLIHDLNVIRQRSHDITNGEITTAQKAFKILMEGEESKFGAIELYVKEILGLHSELDDSRVHNLRSVVMTRDHAMKRMLE